MGVPLVLKLLIATFSVVGAASSSSAQEVAPETELVDQNVITHLNSYNDCLKAFVTPRLKSSKFIPDLVAGAHKSCRKKESSLLETIAEGGGRAQAPGTLAAMNESVDKVMCGLLNSVRHSDGNLSFDTADQCLRGEVTFAPATPRR